MNTVFEDVNSTNRIFVGYRDPTLGKNYIASLQAGAGTSSVMTGVKALHRIRMESASDWNPTVDDPAKPVHGDPATLAAPR